MGTRQTTPPETRRAVEEQAAAIEALTISATPSQAQIQALRDAVASALRAIAGPVA